MSENHKLCSEFRIYFIYLWVMEKLEGSIFKFVSLAVLSNCLFLTNITSNQFPSSPGVENKGKVLWRSWFRWESWFFSIVSGMMPCFGLLMKLKLITHQYFSCCQHWSAGGEHHVLFKIHLCRIIITIIFPFLFCFNSFNLSLWLLRCFSWFTPHPTEWGEWANSCVMLNILSGRTTTMR